MVHFHKNYKITFSKVTVEKEIEFCNICIAFYDLNLGLKIYSDWLPGEPFQANVAKINLFIFVKFGTSRIIIQSTIEGLQRKDVCTLSRGKNYLLKTFDKVD